MAALSLLALALLGWAGPAGAGSCPPAGFRPPPQAVSLSSGMATPIYTGELSRTAIQARASAGGLRGNAVGLTETQTRAEIIPQIWSVDMGKGHRCYGLARAEGIWRLSEIRVYIASEYAPGACNYGRTRDHENQHVEIARDTYRRWLPRMEAALRTAAQTVTPMESTVGMGEAARIISARLLAALRPVLEGYRAEARQRNAAIDTQASYRAVMSRCPPNSW